MRVETKARLPNLTMQQDLEHWCGYKHKSACVYTMTRIS